MRGRARDLQIFAGLAVLSLVTALLFPAIITQLSFLWLMVLFALTWDVMGGQMGYNSFGNILFFGIGAYATAVFQRDAGGDYFVTLMMGLGVSAILAMAAALFFGSALLGLRGHYFAIGTLGLGVAAGELAAGWDFVGAGSGMTPPIFPGELAARDWFFHVAFLALASICFAALWWLYGTRFGLALNAIRDNEDKAEAMGLPTVRIKTAAWMISALFLGVAGGLAGNLIGFIDPRDVAFAGASFGVWMVLMAILGGKGTLWGPVIGAALFHLTQEFLWTAILGWQRVVLGLLIVLVVLMFPQGILGYLRARRQGAGS